MHFDFVSEKTIELNPNNNNVNLYRALVSSVDEQIGRVLDTLSSLGLDEKTLVILTSDNGPVHGSTGPFRGDKSSLFEGGLRVPLLVRWSGVIEAGSENTSISTQMDWLPTLMDYLGLDASGLDLHGRSLLGALLDDQTLPSPGPLFFDFEHKFAVRDGDYKIHQRQDVTDATPSFNPRIAFASFGKESQLNYALSVASLITGPIAILILWRAMKPYAQMYAKAMERD